MDENTLKMQARELAAKLIELSNEIDAYKTTYDWYTWTQNSQLPIAAIDAGVQNLDAVKTDIQTNRRDALYNLAYAPISTE